MIFKALAILPHPSTDGALIPRSTKLMNSTEYRTDSERIDDLLDKATEGPNPDVNNLSNEEQAELEELWHSQGLDLLVCPYRPVPGQDEAEDFQTMPLDGNRPLPGTV